jgi:hypothetical protein
VSRKFIKSCKIINTLSNIFKHFFGKAVQDKELSRRLEMSSLSNYNTFNISPRKQAYLCSMNDFWASRLKFIHPYSDRKADFGKHTFVFKIIFPAWYCKLSMFWALEIAKGNHTAQPCAIEGLEETNVYKYLGVYFSRSLKFTYHKETFIKENVQEKLNYMTRILGEYYYLIAYWLNRSSKQRKGWGQDTSLF